MLQLAVRQIKSYALDVCFTQQNKTELPTQQGVHVQVTERYSMLFWAARLDVVSDGEVRMAGGSLYQGTPACTNRHDLHTQPIAKVRAVSVLVQRTSQLYDKNVRSVAWEITDACALDLIPTDGYFVPTGQVPVCTGLVDLSEVKQNRTTRNL
eukprot:1186575-Prorocentrum_minimum.AAC.2